MRTSVCACVRAYVCDVGLQRCVREGVKTEAWLVTAANNTRHFAVDKLTVSHLVVQRAEMLSG